MCPRRGLQERCSTPCARFSGSNPIPREVASHEHYREATYAARVAEFIAGATDVDTIHDHMGRATLLSAVLTRTAPVVHTCHGPLIEPTGRSSNVGGPGGPHRISGAQRDSAADMPWVGTVHNAVEVDGLAEPGPPAADRPYLVCIARISPSKGQHEAVTGARRAGLRLVPAGKVEESSPSTGYWKECIEPAPIQWDEPFGLSVVEAMVCGTPAISMRRGAAVELVEEVVTGFLTDHVEGRVEAIARCAEIDRVRCADVGRRRFRPATMAAGHVSVYARVVGIGGQA